MTSFDMGDQPSFRVSDNILAGASLAFTYQVGYETGIVRERLMKGPVSAFLYYTNKAEAMERGAEIVLKNLRKKLEDTNVGFGNKKAKQLASEKISARIKEIEEGVRLCTFEGVEFIPSSAREVEGAYLPVGALIYVIDKTKEEPCIDTYAVDDYLYFGGNVIYYQCMPVGGSCPEDATDFRIASDYVCAGGHVFLPASRGEKVAMFWTKFAAKDYLAGNTPTLTEDLDGILPPVYKVIGEDLDLDDALEMLSGEADPESGGPEMSMG